MVIADLHLHTTASDGRLSPRALVQFVAQRGIQFAAVTDHDSTEGLAEAIEESLLFPGLTIIPGIELGTDIPGSEVHVLGYWINYDNPHFQTTLTHFRTGRKARAQQIIENLAGLGIQVEWSRVVELAKGGAIGRPHIAQVMVENGYISQLQDAFDLYLGRNGLAYSERAKLTPEEAIRMLIEVGGVPVLAHPLEGSDLSPLLPRLAKAGLMGIEVYYKNYTHQQIKALKEHASALGLIALGGTDYHAFGTPEEIEPGYSGPPMEEVNRLLSLRASPP